MNIHNILDRPIFYPFEIDGKIYVPSHRELWQEFFYKINIFRDKRTWLAFSTVLINFLLVVPLILFLISNDHLRFGYYFFSFLYAFLFLNIHNTMYLHRFVSHRSFEFRNKIITFIFSHLVIKIVPEEVFGVSHYVHHQLSDLPGDPYNAQSGWLFCFIADVNHQQISKKLEAADFNIIKGWMQHVFFSPNSYNQYLRWGTITSPYLLFLDYLFNWSLWFYIFSKIGGNTFAFLMFATCFFWFISIRNFNFKAHGGGSDRRKKGIDFNQNDFSVNKMLPGFTAGEWHSNHHIFPRSARLDFLKGQLDLSWIVTKFLFKRGIISHYIDSKNQFEEKYLKNVPGRNL